MRLAKEFESWLPPSPALTIAARLGNSFSADSEFNNKDSSLRSAPQLRARRKTIMYFYSMKMTTPTMVRVHAPSTKVGVRVHAPYYLSRWEN